MRYFLLFFSFITAAYAEPAWIMTKHSSMFSYSVDFDCYHGEILESKVVRSGLCTPRYFYDLYSSEGTFLARGVNHVLSLGLLFPSQMEFDIYDENNSYIGYIGGEFWTIGPAEFVFKNAEGKTVGSALLRSDSEQAVFLILSPTNAIVATLNGMLSGNFSGWELHVKQPFEMDERILKIFSAFASDFHESFIRERKTRHYHYHQKN